MGESSVRFMVVGKTDKGKKREVNEDNFFISSDQSTFAVFDGLGGQLYGDKASSLAKKTFATNRQLDIVARIKLANSLIYQQFQGISGTTVTAASVSSNTISIANVGDSRAYLLRGNKIKQLTSDHSWVQEQVDAGRLTDRQARCHRLNNIITRALGTDVSVVVDSNKYQMLVDDIVLLCTDGLTKAVEDEVIYQVLKQTMNLQEAVEQLIVLGNQAGGLDNITIVICQLIGGDNRARIASRNYVTELGIRCITNFVTQSLIKFLC